MKLENENRLLKDLVDRIEVTDIFELKYERSVKKVFLALLEIEVNLFNITEWNNTCKYFMRVESSFKTTSEARYNLMCFLSKERWKFMTDPEI